jgi:hypothetical protein
VPPKTGLGFGAIWLTMEAGTVPHLETYQQLAAIDEALEDLYRLGDLKAHIKLHRVEPTKDPGAASA